jgi:ribosomal protein S8
MIYNSNSIQFFIYLRADLNSHWPITESAQIKTAGLRQHRTKQTIKQQNKEK